MTDVGSPEHRLDAVVRRLHDLGYDAHFTITVDGLASCGVCGVETDPERIATPHSVRTPGQPVLALVCSCCRNRGIARIAEPALPLTR